MVNSAIMKRLHYRSWHRGCKETDLVLGAFADRHLPTLSPELLALYEALLEEDDADIWAWLTGKNAPGEYGELLGMMVVG